MHLLPPMKVMLDFISMLPVQLQGIRNKWTLQKKSCWGPATRRVPYSNHSVRPSVCPSILLSVRQKTCNIGHNFFTLRERSFIFGICDPYDKNFPTVPWILNMWPWAWPLTYFWKNFNIGHNFFIIRDRAFILGMCVPYDKTFPSEPWILNMWPWPLTYFWKTLTSAITFLARRDECPESYCRTPGVGVVHKNFNLASWTTIGRAFIFHMCIPCDKTFPWVPKFLT